jgi:hypothetical protein
MAQDFCLGLREVSLVALGLQLGAVQVANGKALAANMPVAQ